MRFLCAAWVLLLAGCCGGNSAPVDPAKVDPADYQAFFVWAGVPATAVPAVAVPRATRALYILDGEVRAHGAPAFTPLRPQAPRVAKGQVWLTVRLERLDWPEALHQRIAGEIARWERAGTPVVGLTLDFDAKTRGLGAYAGFLREVRRHLPSRYRLSVTGLLDHAAGGDPAALAALGGTVDEVIVQTYQGRRTVPNYAAYLERVARLPMPFRVALVEGGRWRAPPDLERAPNFRGYVVFLLPRRVI